MSRPKYTVRKGYCGYEIHQNGRFCLTNFSREYLSRYQKAVRIYNRAHNERILTIRKVAPYCNNGKDVKDNNSFKPCNSLWAPENVGNLSDFWRIYESLKAGGSDGKEEDPGA